MNNWIVRKLLLIIVGNICISGSARTIPSPFSISFSEWLGELIFSPFSILGATILFILGFLALAFLVKGIILKVIVPYLNKMPIYPGETVIAICTICSFILQIVLHPLIGFLGIILAITYGIMEANEGKVYDRNS
ncbi:hypothetical protein [Alkalihalobacterium elongatum]|uniref:hypothetical protein n=1 Tax=Alkalihalobacterium elongatum TaxID=2675466 RepID=UPI001C1FC393|nr:hypothetical protein [Alkalihalobacterium elongatum]